MSLANVQFRGRSPVFSLPCTRHHHQVDQALDTRRQRGPPCPLQQPPRRSNLQAQNKCRNEINWPLGVSRSVRERMPASDPWAHDAIPLPCPSAPCASCRVSAVCTSCCRVFVLPFFAPVLFSFSLRANWAIDSSVVLPFSESLRQLVPDLPLTLPTCRCRWGPASILRPLISRN
jgi:hypothetical protein